jgi:hypothetical protein
MPSKSWNQTLYLERFGVLVDLRVGDLGRAQEENDEEAKLVFRRSTLVVLEDLEEVDTFLNHRYLRVGVRMIYTLAPNRRLQILTKFFFFPIFSHGLRYKGRLLSLS